jgi:ABC-2 type transport system permease protein
MNSPFVMLIKREFWEHRSLWMAPAIFAAVLIVLAVFGAFFGSSNFHVGAPMRFGPERVGVTQMGAMAMAMQLYAVSALTCGFYLLDCLYSERKDRSILFWKSLPVSDLQTVLAKLTVAMAVVPAGVFVLTTVTYPLIYGIATTGLPNFAAVTGGWDFGAWLRTEGFMLASVALTLLWYAPVAAWLMLASVAARRSPIMIFTLPIVALAVCENVLLGTGNVWKFAGYRLMPIVDPSGAVSRPGLWLGLAVTAGILYIVIRLRRYRDDT